MTDAKSLDCHVNTNTYTKENNIYNTNTNAKVNTYSKEAIKDSLHWFSVMETKPASTDCYQGAREKSIVSLDLFQSRTKYKPMTNDKYLFQSRQNTNHKSIPNDKYL